jgi:hypothetical protein
MIEWEEASSVTFLKNEMLYYYLLVQKIQRSSINQVLSNQQLLCRSTRNVRKETNKYCTCVLGKGRQRARSQKLVTEVSQMIFIESLHQIAHLLAEEPVVPPPIVFAPAPAADKVVVAAKLAEELDTPPAAYLLLLVVVRIVVTYLKNTSNFCCCFCLNLLFMIESITLASA